MSSQVVAEPEPVAAPARLAPSSAFTRLAARFIRVEPEEFVRMFGGRAVPDTDGKVLALRCLCGTLRDGATPDCGACHGNGLIAPDRLAVVAHDLWLAMLKLEAASLTGQDVAERIAPAYELVTLAADGVMEEREELVRNRWLESADARGKQ